MTETVPSHREPDAAPVGHMGSRVEIHERQACSTSGWFGVLLIAICIAACFVLGHSSIKGVIAVPIVVAVIVFSSLVIVQPGETRVVRFFGSYVGSLRRTGLSWILPLADRRKVSIRVRNFETNHLKVNDAEGNPVEIAAIVVWQVADTSKALYAVDDYLNFVRARPRRPCVTSRPRILTTTRRMMDCRFVARPTSSLESSPSRWPSAS